MGYSGCVKWVEGDKKRYLVYAINDVVVFYSVESGEQQFLCGANGKISALGVSFPLPHVTPHRPPPPAFVAVAQEKPSLIRIRIFFRLNYI